MVMLFSTVFASVQTWISGMEGTMILLQMLYKNSLNHCLLVIYAHMLY
uniref:Asteroid homolog 1 n=1 Tax=Pan troglodytes TaxID=9598 RepID=G2HFT1_PANTR|nr:asteroid homolog 1 [Pan troglodytes]